MKDNLNQPSRDDGIEGVKRRLASDAIEQKVAAIADAFNYGNAGLNLVINVLKDESSPIQSVAYLLLKESPERQVKEALQEYFKNKKQAHELVKFVSFTVNELQTNINGIIGYQKLILDGSLDGAEEERDMFNHVQKLAVDLNDLLNDLPNVAKIEIDKMYLNLGEVKLNELFKDVEKFTQALIQTKRLKLLLAMPTNSHEISLYGNYTWLLQIMSILVENAIKFTDEGRLKITGEVIKEKAYLDSREFLSIEVDSDPTKPYKTDGLKREIAKRLVEYMGGEIIFYNSCTATFTIPMLPISGAS